MYTNLCDKLYEQHVSYNDKDVEVYFYWCLPRQYLHSLYMAALEIVCLIHILIYRECLCF